MKEFYSDYTVRARAAKLLGWWYEGGGWGWLLGCKAADGFQYSVVGFRHKDKQPAKEERAAILDLVRIKFNWGDAPEGERK